VIPDPDRVCPLFLNVQLYSVDTSVSKEVVTSILELSREKLPGDSPNPFFGIGICEPGTLICPCSPSNNLRVLKLGKMDSIKNIEHRSAPFLLLQQLNLVVEVFPLSSFYYKIRLAPLVTDLIFLSSIRSFNGKMGEGGLFHSLWDGRSTTLFRPPTQVPPARLILCGGGRRF